jgi:tight adherence protein B
MWITVVLLAAAAASGVFVLLSLVRKAAVWWTTLAGQRTETDLASLFVFIPASRLLLCSALLGGCVALIAAGLHWPMPVIIVTSLACLAMPRMVLRWLRNRWRRRVALQLPDALSSWAGLLRAGQSSQQALVQVGQRQPAPLGNELRLVLGELRMGVPVEVAFAALRERAGVPDLRLLSTLLATQRELGGNLAESLQRLSDLLRGRLLMEARIASLTAQGRMQGVVVGVLPLLLLAVLYVMERDAMEVLHTTWQGWSALAAIALLEVLGFFLIRRIVRIEV